MRVRRRIGAVVTIAVLAASLPLAAGAQSDEVDVLTDQQVDTVTDRPIDRVTDRPTDRVTDRPYDRCDIRRFAATHPDCVTDHGDLNIRQLIHRLVHAGEWEKLVRLLHRLGLI